MHIRTAFLLAACVLATSVNAAGRGAGPADYKWGVNAAVGSATALVEVRESYQTITDAVMKNSGVRLETFPLYSSFVKTALQNSTYPIMLIHTHDAAKAVRSGQFVLIALSDDSEGNRVTFLTKKDAPFQKLSELAGKCVVSTGSFGTAAAEYLLKKEGIRDQLKEFRYVRDADAVPFFLDNQFCDVGATRSAGQIKKWQDAGGKILFQSEPYPVYAVIAKADLPSDLTNRLRKSLVAFKPEPDSVFAKRTKIVGFRPADEQAQAVLAVFE